MLIYGNAARENTRLESGFRGDRVVPTVLCRLARDFLYLSPPALDCGLDWPARGGETGSHDAPLDLPEGLDRAQIAAAFGAVIAAAGDREPVDLALGLDRTSPVAAQWAPLRVNRNHPWLAP